MYWKLARSTKIKALPSTFTDMMKGMGPALHNERIVSDRSVYNLIYFAPCLNPVATPHCHHKNPGKYAARWCAVTAGVACRGDYGREDDRGIILIWSPGNKWRGLHSIRPPSIRFNISTVVFERHESTDVNISASHIFIARYRKQKSFNTHIHALLLGGL